MGCLFTLLIVSFDAQKKFLILTKSIIFLYFFSICCLCFGCQSIGFKKKKCLLTFGCPGSSLLPQATPWLCSGLLLWWLLLLWSSGSRPLWCLGLTVPWHEGSSRTRDWTSVSCIARQILNHWTTREASECRILRSSFVESPQFGYV